MRSPTRRQRIDIRTCNRSKHARAYAPIVRRSGQVLGRGVSVIV